MKNIVFLVKKWVVLVGVLLALSFYLLNRVLNVFHLELRNWIIYLVVLISFILIICGFFQILSKVKWKALKISLISASIAALILSSPYVLLAGFSYTPEYVVLKNEKKLVAYVNGFMHTNGTDYDYKNFLLEILVCDYMKIMEVVNLILSKTLKELSTRSKIIHGMIMMEILYSKVNQTWSLFFLLSLIF